MKKRLIHTFLFSSLLLISVFFPTQKSFAAQCYDKNGQGIPLSAISNSSMCTSPNQWLDVAPPTNVTVLGAPAPQQVAVPEKPAWCDGFIDCLFSLSTGALSVAAGKIIAPLLSMLAFVMLKIVSLFMGLAGILLNYTLQETVVNMTARINSVTGINVAWKVIRDLMNIGFIFLLLYEGIKLILSQDNIDSIRKFILGIVLASLLINFSLFFTKVIIDTSNIFTIGIYNIIIGDTDSTGTVATVSTSNAYGGLSNAFMSALGVQEFFSTKSLPLPGGTGGLEDDYSHLTTNIMASILIIITTVVFLAVTFMFITRYIVLIFLLALSPIAYMGMALPGVGSYAKSWWDSLWGQIIFGPLYMIMTWVTLTLIAGNLAQPVDAQSIGVQSMQDTGGFSSSANILFNFTLVIGMTIASLVTAKNFSTKGAKEIGKLSSSITSLAFASTAWAGRKSLGSLGNRLSDSAALQDAANRDRKGEGRIKSAVFGGAARAALYTTKAARNATFDARNASVPTGVLGDLVEGTVGRTKYGKMAGLNDLNIQNVPVMENMSGYTGFGKGGTKGYVDEANESAKRVAKETAEIRNEYELSKATKIIEDGAKEGALADKIEDMEKVLAKLSTKQVESIVAGNEKLLESQSFANAISVKQLEAINKSSDISDSGKGALNKNRFSSIDDIRLASSQLFIDANAKQKAQRSKEEQELVERVNKAKGKIKGLVDSEIELLSSEQLSDESIVSEFRSAQFESIAKNTQFTSSQKKRIKDIRMNPLLNALDKTRTDSSGNSTFDPKPKKVTEMITKGLSAKDVAGLMSTTITYDVTDQNGQIIGEEKDKPLLLHPEVIENLTPGLIKKMMAEMSAEDVTKLREAVDKEISKYPNGIPTTKKGLIKVEKWLGKPESIDFE